MPGKLKEKELIEHLKKKQIYVDDIGDMFLPEYARDSMIRLSVSQVDEALIDTGVRLIASEISRLF